MLCAGIDVVLIDGEDAGLGEGGEQGISREDV